MSDRLDESFASSNLRRVPGYRAREIAWDCACRSSDRGPTVVWRSEYVQLDKDKHRFELSSNAVSVVYTLASRQQCASA